MKDARNRFAIAYLAPEIPAISATFVYEELLGIERRGLSVIPFSVHRPSRAACGQAALLERTRIVYEGSKLGMLAQGLVGMPLFGRSAWKALRWLATDMAELGLLKLQSWKLAFQFLAAVRLARLLKQHRCVHLHVHFAHVPTQIAMYASALSGIPFTVMAHANDIFERGLLLPRKAQRALKFLTISEYNCEHLKRNGVEADRLAVVRCGVSFSAQAAPRPVMPRERYRLGTLGRLVEKKGVDVLIRALAELRGGKYSVELDIAGDGPLRNELEALAAELGLAESVHFKGGLAHGEVAAWMGGLDAFVLACKQDANGDMDGIPVVLMEAMSQFVPVVSTRLSGVPELVVHEATGLLAIAADPVDLACQIDRLLMSEALRRDLAAGAHAHVMQEFSQEVNLDRLLGHWALAEHAPRQSGL